MKVHCRASKTMKFTVPQCGHTDKPEMIEVPQEDIWVKYPQELNDEEKQNIIDMFAGFTNHESVNFEGDVFPKETLLAIDFSSIIPNTFRFRYYPEGVNHFYDLKTKSFKKMSRTNCPEDSFFLKRDFGILVRMLDNIADEPILIENVENV